MRIWLLAIGEYSNYTVRAVYDEAHLQEGEKMAELIGGRIEGRDYEEEPLILNHFDHEAPPAGTKYYQLTMYRDGTMAEKISEYSLLKESGKLRESFYWLETNRRYKFLRKSHWRLSVGMYARSQEHIVKVANEIRTRILAGALPDEGPIP